MKILIIEDEEKLAKALKKGFEKEGFAADYVLDGESGQRRLEVNHTDYDLVILDLMLPKKDGFEICRNIRNAGIVIPVLILTARGTVDDKVTVLNAGADDYLVKPFSFKELVARARALLRRPEPVLSQKLEAGELSLDINTRKAFINGREISLTLKEFEMLEYFMRNPNQVLNREQILSRVWDFEFDSFSNVVDAHIKNLRKKLNNGKSNKTIFETVRGIGYRLKA